MNICVVRPNATTNMESFIRAHLERLPGKVTLIEGGFPRVAGRPVKSQAILLRSMRRVWRSLCGKDWSWELTSSYGTAFRRARADVVLAEYGPTGVRVLDACRRLRIPLVVHFHGYDTSVRSVLAEHSESYPTLFQHAAALIVVSREMQDKLISLGAPLEKIHRNPYGVDCYAFNGAQPATAGPVFLAVGRFVEKKAPQLTLRAFAAVRRACAEAQLRMVGDGRLLGLCRDLAMQLGVADAVTFLGEQPSIAIPNEMRRARCFVQHSVEAANGDCEGTPVAVIEAGASGLPVVATRHGGIPDVVIDGESGFLVDERDIDSMAARMIDVITNPALAERMGQAARRRVADHFSIDRHIEQLGAVIERCFSQTGTRRSAELSVSEAA